MGYGIIEISDKALLAILHLQDAEVANAHWDMERRILQLAILHDELPVPNEAILPLPVRLELQVNYCDHTCEFGQHRRVLRLPLSHYGVTMQSDIEEDTNAADPEPGPAQRPRCQGEAHL